jgi:hypothetical protein
VFFFYSKVFMTKCFAMKITLTESQLREYIKNAICETIDPRKAAALMGRTANDYQNDFQFLQDRSRNPFAKGNDALQGVKEYDEMLKEFQDEMRRISNAIRYIRSHNGMTTVMSADQKAKRNATRQQNNILRQQYAQQTGQSIPTAKGANYQYQQKEHPDFVRYGYNNNGNRSVNNAGQTGAPTNIGATNMPKRGKFSGTMNEGIFSGIKNYFNQNKIQNAINACEQVIASAKEQMTPEQAEQKVVQLRQYYAQFKDWYIQLKNIKDSIMQRSGVVDQNAEDRKKFNQGFNAFKKNNLEKQTGKAL